MNRSAPKVWDILTIFKGNCHSRGWIPSEREDWVRTEDGKYHNFLWVQTVHPTTFEKIASKHKCAVSKGTYYEVVNVSYTAWLFTRSLPENCVEILQANPELSGITALYDLSPLYGGDSFYFKMNGTDSIVLEAFERFLNKEFNIESKSLPNLVIH
jgi:hypothetical protein